MTTDISLPCLKCGRPASKEHHQPPDRNAVGMGGSSDPDVEDWRCPLCRTCHESVGKTWRLKLEDGFATGFDLKGTVLFVRAYEPLETALSLSSYPQDILKKYELLRFLTDENLAYFIGLALMAAKMNVLNIGMAADVFRERYAQYGDKWYIRAAEFIRDNNQEGQTISPRELYSAHAAYRAFADRPEAVALLSSKSLVYACAEADDPKAAIDFASVAQSEGRRVTVGDVRERFGHKSSGLTDDRIPCEVCGGKGWVKKQPEEQEITA